MISITQQRRRHRADRRSGTALTELCVIMPLFLTVAVGTTEICQVIFAKQALQAAAHECARVAADAAGSNARVEQRMQTILDARGIEGGTVTTEPADVSAIPRGTRVRVTVSAPIADNTTFAARFFTQSMMQASTTNVKEL